MGGECALHDWIWYQKHKVQLLRVGNSARSAVPSTAIRPLILIKCFQIISSTNPMQHWTLDNLATCNNCKEKTPYKTMTTMNTYQKVLVIQLNRFHYVTKNNITKKDNVINAPLDIRLPDSNEKYTLFGTLLTTMEHSIPAITPLPSRSRTPLSTYLTILESASSLQKI